MNTDIMYLANKYIYNQQLKSGNEDVANQALILNLDKRCLAGAWLKEILYPEKYNGVIFVDTSNLIPEFMDF